MQYSVKQTPNWGRVLWLQNNSTQIGVALDFGIRIVHLSCPGMENLFYEQPGDRSDGFTTEGGWILYGGHRLWLAPESDDSYYPDVDPVEYEVSEDRAVITQRPDPFMHIQKSICIIFQGDGSVRLEQQIRNISDRPISGAAWGVNTLDAGGTAWISFSAAGTGEYNPSRVVALWSQTDLHDARLHFAKDHLLAKHLPSKEYLKIGLYSNPGKAVFVNKDQQFTLTFDAQPMECYADCGCNFELYMCSQFMELESLGVKTAIQPGQSAVHVETWHLETYNG